MNQLIKSFLQNFLGLFGVTRIIINSQQNVITGMAYWDNELDNENIQNFLWKRPEIQAEKIDRLISLCDFIKSKKLVSTDRILVSERKLVQMLKTAGWEKNVAQSTINELCDIEIKMIDEGKETDSFFIHF